MSEHSGPVDPAGTANARTAPPPSRAAAPLRATVAAAKAAPIPAGRTSSLLMAHGSMQVRFYAPRGVDGQTPHAQDELYVVVQGSGSFVCRDERTPFGPGDVLFVPAGAVHRFEDFGDDFGVWVIFYGPEGGEAPR